MSSGVTSLRKKVWLDENLDHALRHLLGHRSVVTAVYMGWNGVKNGKLLRAAEDNGSVDVLLTGDTIMISEQNLKGRCLAVGALSVIELPIIRQHLAKIIAAASARQRPPSISAQAQFRYLCANLNKK